MSALPAPRRESSPQTVDLLAVSLGRLIARLDAATLSPLERLKLTKELASVREALGQNPTTMQRLKLAQRLGQIREQLGVGKPAAATTVTPPPIDPNEPPPPTIEDDIIEGRTERPNTARFYEFDENRKPAQRKRENAAAMDLLRQIDAGIIKADALTDEQRATLAKYSGTGGGLVGADGKRGSAYEYYTPKPIAEGVWSLLAELGFAGGRTLDPSAGTGVFGSTAPKTAVVDAIELNETSGRVNQLVNDGPGYSTTIAPFEQVAAATPDEGYDAVVTNVPFGEVNDRGGNQYKDTKYRNEPLQNYFVLRSLEKLRPGGLAAFIVPPRVVSGKGGKEQDLRERVAYMAEFVGAYRLPNSVFGTAAADTMTDVIIFRKFSRDVLDKIAELREQNPALLNEAGVVWPEFIEGNYFRGEGLRFVIGTMGRAKGQFGEKDVLNSDLSMVEIARLMRKFGPSRIKWDLLEAAETTPIVYRDGDTMQHAGETLQMVEGRWVRIKSASNEQAGAALADLTATLSTPLGAVNAAISFEAAARYAVGMVDSAQALLIPEWLRTTLNGLERCEPGKRASAWNAAIVGLAVDQVMEEHQGETTGFNYLEAYAALSDAMKRTLMDAKSPPSALPSKLKKTMGKVAVFYSKADGFSAVWRGDVAADVDARSSDQRFEAERYQAGGGAFVNIDVARAVHGAAFDPLADDEWCVSADGRSVARADDYYVGNYADFLIRIKADIEAATDDTIRSKLVRQKRNAEARLLRADPSRMTFTLFSPFVTMEERAEFLRRFVDPRFAVGFDPDTGAPMIEFAQVGAAKDARDKLLKRMALYLNGTRLSLGGAEFADEKQAIEALRTMTTTAEAQFNSWVKANTVIMGRLSDVANDPTRIYFKQVEDETPLVIPGLHPDWETKPYQNAWVRKMGREFGGINGDGVGLGKTSQGLIAVQHAQAIGVKKKTMLVVPNSVLSNWRKEAGRVYESTADCLFVGLRPSKDGSSFRTDTSQYDVDLNRVLENRHRKIFVTYEAFQRLRLRATTAEAYDAYLARVDKTYADSDLTKKAEKGKSLRAALIEQLTSSDAKSVAAPFFEDMGVDSLVIDEAHFLKNSRQTIEFKGGKFLSLAAPSARGIDAQAKCWWVRKDAPRKDGVILLTATPITNSPLEIYSMLALAVGDEKLNDMMVGIKGADQFMDVMCKMENSEEETLDGLTKAYDVFVGLNNVNILRNALAATTTMRTAEQVGAQIVVPDADEEAAAVSLPESVVDVLVEYKEAYRWAIDTLNDRGEVRGSQEAYERVAAKFGEPLELIGHPFNLINKMTSLIADPELDQRATFYFVGEPQAEKAAALVEKWNTKPPVEDRPRLGPQTDRAAVVGKKVKKDGDDEVTLLRVQVRAKLDGERIVLDTLDHETQVDFEALAEKMAVELDVSLPPKLAAMLANFQKEEANPRGRVEGLPSGRVRQLIFCDNLALHAKIKRLLVTRAGVSAASIAIITGKVNGKPEEILGVQDGFNAEGDGNRYRVVIANEKAEVGINLQKGTQAIHHLSIGWTPDSLTQRNGRGVRQGNETARVRVYHYDADGTFDVYKRALVGKKSSWIDALVDPNGDDTVNVTGGLTREQLDALIDTVGQGGDAMAAMQARNDAAERLARETSTRGKQAVNLQTIRMQREFVETYPDARAWAADKVQAYVLVGLQMNVIQNRIEAKGATASAVLKNQNVLAELTAKRNGLRRMIDESVVIREDRSKTVVTIDSFVQAATRKIGRGETAPSAAAKALRSGYASYSSYEITVSEAGTIGNEWRSEVDMANAMIKASQEDFARLSAQNGGYSKAVLARADAGEAQVLDGRVLCAGAFFERDGLLGYVYLDGSLMVRYRDAETNKRVAAADEARHATVTLPGAPGYEALLTRAATIEDAIAEGGGVAANARDTLYSSTIPEVAQRRAKPLPVRYSGSGYDAWELPSPYFPTVIQAHDLPDGLAVVPLIVAQQAAVVLSTETPYSASSLYFTCDSTVAVTKAEGSKGSFTWEAVMDFAASRKAKLTAADFEVLNAGRYARVTSALVNRDAKDFAAAVLDGATTAPELAQRLAAWMADEAFPQYDLSTDDDYKADPVAFLSSSNFNAGYAYRKALTAIERAAQAAAGTAPVGTGQPAVPVEVSAEDANRIVGITGDTKRWKEQIKDYARRAGGRPIWDGDAKRWNVPFKAWAMMVAAMPQVEASLQMVEASGKMNYGRRG